VERCPARLRRDTSGFFWQLARCGSCNSHRRPKRGEVVEEVVPGFAGDKGRIAPEM